MDAQLTNLGDAVAGRERQSVFKSTLHLDIRTAFEVRVIRCAPDSPDNELAGPGINLCWLATVRATRGASGVFPPNLRGVSGPLTIPLATVPLARRCGCRSLGRIDAKSISMVALRSFARLPSSWALPSRALPVESTTLRSFNCRKP